MSGSLGLTQAGRLLTIESTLGKDTLILRQLSVREAIGQPYTIRAEVISERMTIAPADVVDTPITCTVRTGSTEPRHFHGLVRSIAATGAYGRGLAGYTIEAVPRLWQTSYTADCRVFQEKSVKDIATAILAEHNVAPVRWGASVPTGRRPYCVQYNELDVDFLQRLLEEVGCGYFFEHGANDHTLVVAGGIADFPLIKGQPREVRNDRAMRGALTEWQAASGLKPKSVHAVDFDNLHPTKLLEAKASAISRPHGGAGAEVFLWPGGQTVRPDADPAKLAMEGFEAAADRVNARGSDPALFAGGRVKVKAGLDDAKVDTWLLTEVRHDAYDETQLADNGIADYTNALSLMPADRPWRPAAPPRRPVMPGLCSALVTGPGGDEIHCDAHGRVKVRFPWDRAGTRDNTSSCWVRVAQPLAGKWGGSWMLPRVGDEVLVAFLDGDPDRPVVVGSLYNDDAKPIYGLPANKTQTGLKTRSSTGGGAANFNELRFEDKKGSEEVFLQAERDFTGLIKNDRTVTIKQGNDTLTIETGNRVTTLNRGNDTLTLDQGNLSIKASMGKIAVEAMQSITLTCGQSKLELTPTGITLSTVMLKCAAQAMLETKAPMSKHSGDAMMVIKGGLVMIN